MNKPLKVIALICLLSLIFFTGCNNEKDEEDLHYKPSEYKHNVAISNASIAIDDVNREIISMGAETSADVVYDTYNDGIKKLNEHLNTLENTKKQLSEDKDLTKSELKDWNSRYDDSITAVKNNIANIEKQKANFLK